MKRCDISFFPAVFLAGVAAGTGIALLMCYADGLSWFLTGKWFGVLRQLGAGDRSGRWMYVLFRRGLEAAWFVWAASRRIWFRKCAVCFFGVGAGIGWEMASLTLLYGADAFFLFLKINIPVFS